MRVKWIVPLTAMEEDLEGWHGGPLPLIKHEGEVIGTVRAFGETRLVVMLDSGSVAEVNAGLVERAT